MLYDSIGAGYSTQRVPDPRIAQLLDEALGDAATVANVGAGAGSYEPFGRCRVAIEPSMTMIRQRSDSAAPAVQAVASQLPLRDGCVAAALAILTVHHWQDRQKGLDELARIATQRVVILTWDPDSPGFWLTDGYFPAILEHDREKFPRIGELARLPGRLSVRVVPVPHDCTDGFLGAYWRRPAAYLEAGVRAGMSTFAKIGRLDAGLGRLRADLESGEWGRRYGDVLGSETLDLGYRIVTIDLSRA